jgi:hypothetical protein
MEKTAMQELIEKIEKLIISNDKLIDDIDDTNKGFITNLFATYLSKTFLEFKKMAEPLLEKEKKQIIDAIQWGVDTINENEKATEKIDKYWKSHSHELFPEDYYNINYGKKVKK